MIYNTHTVSSYLNDRHLDKKSKGNVGNIFLSFHFDFENLEVGVCLKIINFTIYCLKISVLL